MKFLSVLVMFSLCSCGLIRAPIRVAGGVVGGTMKAGRALAEKPGDALAERRARKEAEERKAETRQAAARDSGPSLSGDPPRLGSSPGLDGNPSPPLGPPPEDRDLPAESMRAPTEPDELPSR